MKIQKGDRTHLITISFIKYIQEYVHQEQSEKSVQITF